MKKRAKIITTVASLCLAVALMAFGVYAATSVTVGLTSTVRFEVTDIFVTIDAKVELEGGIVGTAYQYKSYTEANGIKTAKNAGEDTSAPSDTSESDWTATEVQYLSTDKVATYTIRVTNDGAAPVTVDISALTFPVVANTFRNSTVKEWDATANDNEGAYGTPAANSVAETATAPGNAAIAWLEDDFEVAAGKYVEFVLTRTVINDAIAIANNTPSLGGSITVTLTSALD